MTGLTRPRRWNSRTWVSVVSGSEQVCTFLDVPPGAACQRPGGRLGARVLATDQSPVMLDLLAKRAGKDGTGSGNPCDGRPCSRPSGRHLRCRRSSQFGVMLFPDMPKGIREMARVVKPGGSVLIHAYGDPHEIDFLGFLIHAIQLVRPDFNGPAMDPPPYEFQLADPRRLHSEFEAAGLKNIMVETIIEMAQFESGDALWDWIEWSNPIVETILGSLNLMNDERRLIKRSLDTMVSDRSTQWFAIEPTAIVQQADEPGQRWQRHKMTIDSCGGTVHSGGSLESLEAVLAARTSLGPTGECYAHQAQ